MNLKLIFIMKCKILVFIFICFCNASICQSKKILKYPEIFNKPYCKSGNCNSLNNVISGSVKNSFWVVYSDRNNNKSYSHYEIGSDVKYDNINIGEYFYVIEDREDWVHVYKGSRIRDGRFFSTTKGSIDYGWMLKSDLLLWKFPIVDNSYSKMYTKAFINFGLLELCRSIALKDINPKCLISSNPFYSDNDQYKFIDYKGIYYVMKEANGYYLLSAGLELNDSNVSQSLLGWIEKRNCTIWKNNLALEPNFDSRAITERIYGAPIKGYDNMGEAIQYSRKINSSEAKWNFDPAIDQQIGTKTRICDGNDKRYPGAVLRFPVFSSLSGHKAGYIKSIAQYTPKLEEVNKFYISMFGRKISDLDSLDSYLTNNDIFDLIYFPSKLGNQKYDPFSYVLFISEDELHDYRQVLTKIEQAYDKPSNEQRDALYDGFSFMLRSHSGGGFDKKDLEKSSSDEILEKSLGLASEMGKQFFPSYKIGDIHNKKKLSDQFIDAEIKRLRNLKSGISAIIKEGSSYCYKYKPAGSSYLYYWIPLNMLF